MSENLPALRPPVTVGPDQAGPKPAPDPLENPDRARRIRRMVSLARLMDSCFQIPGTNYSIGIDPLVGLIPLLGDVLTTGVSLFIMYDAIKIGATSNQILRMTANICIDFILGEIMLVGDVVDFAWKANMRNLEVMGIPPTLEPTTPPDTIN